MSAFADPEGLSRTGAACGGLGAPDGLLLGLGDSGGRGDTPPLGVSLLVSLGAGAPPVAGDCFASLACAGAAARAAHRDIEQTAAWSRRMALPSPAGRRRTRGWPHVLAARWLDRAREVR